MSRSLEEALVEYLRARQLLLVLDNFEQVLPARRHWGAAGGRTATQAPGDQPRHSASMASTCTACPRSRAARPGRCSWNARGRVGVTPRRARPGIVSEICGRLEGLPLAIELAASRARTQPSGTTGTTRPQPRRAVVGPTDFSPRQRSMRGALDWSYELLGRTRAARFRTPVRVLGWRHARSHRCSRCRCHSPGLDVTRAVEGLANEPGAGERGRREAPASRCSKLSRSTRTSGWSSSTETRYPHPAAATRRVLRQAGRAGGDRTPWRRPDRLVATPERRPGQSARCTGLGL